MKMRVSRLTILVLWLVSALAPPIGGATAHAQTTEGPSPSHDRDYDGLTDAVEGDGWLNGAGTFVTDPLDPDSDDDGLSDGKEKLFETDPLDDHSPGIFVEYKEHLQTRQYYSRDTAHSEFEGGWQPWGWQQFGDQMVSFGAVVVRRGATFSVGGPADGTLTYTRSIDTLTPLTITRDCCNGQWNVAVPPDGTVGMYELVTQEGDWSQHLDLYVIFELPEPNEDLTQLMIDAFLYDDDPDDIKDEIGVLLLSNNDDLEYHHSEEPEHIPPPPHDPWVTEGHYYRFELQQFEPYVFETHVITTINGLDNQEQAAEALVNRTDMVTRFDNPRPLVSSWRVLHPPNDEYENRQQCSNISALVAAFERSAGIPSRPIFTDWVHSTFDHATEIWLDGEWKTARGYNRREDDPNCGWDCGEGYNPPTTRAHWGRSQYRPWHYHGRPGHSSLIATVDETWPFLGMAYRWASWDWDGIVRRPHAPTLSAPYWGYWGWTEEPEVLGTPPNDWVPITDYAVQVTPDSQTVQQGSAIQYTVRLTTANGFSNYVDLTEDSYDSDPPYTPEIEGLPAGASATIDLHGCVPDCSATVTITPTRETVTDTYDLTLSAYSDRSLLREDSFEMVVTEAPDPDFILDASPDSQTAEQGETANYLVTIQPLYGFDEIVSLSASDLPPSSTATFSPSSLVFPPYDPTTMSITTASDTPTGTYTVTVNGDSLSLHRETAVELIVTEATSGTSAATSLLASTDRQSSPSRQTPGLSIIAGSTTESSAPALRTGADAPEEFSVERTSDDVVDRDGDGFYDQLVVEVVLNVPHAGSYWFQGELGPQDSAVAPFGSGGLVAVAVVRADLEAGTGVVRLPFNGRALASTGADVPYVLKTLTVADEAELGTIDATPGPNDFANHALEVWRFLHTTATYSARDFENRGAALTGQIAERGLDRDRDRLYDGLMLSVALDIFDSETYTVRGALYDGQDRFVGHASGSGTGDNIRLLFDELTGTAGPYRLQELSLIDARGEVIDQMTQVYTTTQVIQAESQSHIVSESPADELATSGIVTPTETYTDAGLDLDDDGLYDLLVIDVQVEVTEEDAGPHRLEGWLEAQGSLISWTSGEAVDLISGTHTLSLTFSGPAINAHNIAGPFDLTALKLLRGDSYEILDEVEQAYSTQAYTPDQFDSLPYLQLGPDDELLFQDHLEAGAGNWTAETPWALVTDPHYSPLHAWADSPAGHYADDSDVALTTTPISLGGFSWPTLQFQTCYDLESDADHGYVEISTDGVTWSSIVSYTGQTTHWSSQKLSLGALGDSESLQVRFRLETNGEVGAEGWHIDNVSVYHDNDLDDDGISNDVEVGDDPDNPRDSDGDGAPDYLDEDADDDGLPDATEGTDDSDGDGLPNYRDEDADDDGIPDATEGDIDSDGDGTPDYLDQDSDDDGIPDATEGADDADGDGTPNYLDEDADDDGIPDATEGADDPDNDETPNFLDQDSDDDGIPDATEGAVDSDGDGTPDYLDEDADDDGIPDATEGDGDADGDGTPNYLDDDADDDGIPDATEGAGDPDGDGIPNFLDQDADDDGIPDATEGTVDSDGDGTPDYLDEDSDDDGIPDATEGTVDTDEDSTPDYRDQDSDDDGLSDAQEWSSGSGDPLAGCTADDPLCTNNDADEDGTANYRDTDADDDGALDSFEGTGDADEDGIANFVDPDSAPLVEFMIYLPMIQR